MQEAIEGIVIIDIIDTIDAIEAINTINTIDTIGVIGGIEGWFEGVVLILLEKRLNSVCEVMGCWSFVLKSLFLRI